MIDLVNPDAWQYIFDRVDALLRENNISYLKWDQNRDQLEHGHAGRSSVHEQTLAAYRLFDELEKTHPGVEIESCSSGGPVWTWASWSARTAIWASDCNDALERQTIQRWTGLVVPPELVGGHVGPTTSHTTARTHGLSFRAITALFGHFGMEWDVRGVQGAEREELKRFIAIYKEHRGLDPLRAHGPLGRARRFPDAARRRGPPAAPPQARSRARRRRCSPWSAPRTALANNRADLHPRPGARPEVPCGACLPGSR